MRTLVPRWVGRTAEAQRRKGNETGDGSLSEGQLRYHAYWQAFKNYLQQQPGLFHIGKPPTAHWCGFGKSRANISVTLRPKDGRLGVEVYIDGPNAKNVFRNLETQKSTIKEEISAELDWQLLPHRRACRIAIYKCGESIFDEATWSQQHAWLLDFMTKLYDSFAPRLAAIGKSSS
jgi:hypothetical protein